MNVKPSVRRDALAKEKLQKCIDGKENYFFAIFLLPTGSDDYNRLMKLH